MDGHLRIEICGGIASGKTSLATLLATDGIQVGFENFSANPFFADFYRDPVGNAFETEITFLLQHFNLIKSAQRRVSQSAFDYSLALDEAYAEITLLADDLRVFHSVLKAVTAKIGWPSLLIRLRCSASEELRRIKRRGRQQEQGIELPYLEQLECSLTKVLKSPLFGRSQIIEIDSEGKNFVSDPIAMAEVLETIRSEMQVEKQTAIAIKSRGARSE